MTALAIAVVLVVFGPLAIFVPAVLALWAMGVLAGERPQVVRTRFRCPVTRRMVTADFAVSAGADQPGAVVACSAFPEPTRVACARRCLEVAEARRAGPVGLFGRWALLGKEDPRPAGWGLAPLG